MSKENEIAFLCKRLKKLREKNNCTMDEMAQKLAINGIAPNKSSISRVESGKTSKKTLIENAKKYCEVFGMSEEQTNQFLRGERIAVPDTSALLKNSQLIDELNKEYSRVIIPKVVVNEQAVELFGDQLYTIRTSKNSFVGANVNKQTGGVGPDTTMRLFNQI